MKKIFQIMGFVFLFTALITFNAVIFNPTGMIYNIGTVWLFLVVPPIVISLAVGVVLSCFLVKVY